jgi:predicted site-specific integrase-resolvase
MKLSQYAKILGISYRTAWNYFKQGSIPGAYKLPSGTIIVPDNAIPKDTVDTPPPKEGDSFSY